MSEEQGSSAASAILDQIQARCRDADLAEIADAISVLTPLAAQLIVAASDGPDARQRLGFIMAGLGLSPLAAASVRDYLEAADAPIQIELRDCPGGDDCPHGEGES